MTSRALDWIDQARAYKGKRVRGLALTGGEPFVDQEQLAEISAYGAANGMIVSAVTNAYWAKSRDEALDVLSRLPAIRMLSISTDIFHQKVIPFERVRNALVAARELGRLYNIAVCTDSRDEEGFRRIIEELNSIGETDTLRISIIFPVGRAQRKARLFSYHMSRNPAQGACSMASSPVVFPNGDVVACIGPPLTILPPHPMYLGNAVQESMSDILDRAEHNPVLHAVRVWGPEKLASLLADHGYGSLLPDQYISDCACDVCYKLFSDKKVIDALDEIFSNEDIQELLAYARLYYLDETNSLEGLHLGENLCGPPAQAGPEPAN